jgi:hypothetical protein
MGVALGTGVLGKRVAKWRVRFQIDDDCYDEKHLQEQEPPPKKKRSVSGLVYTEDEGATWF